MNLFQLLGYDVSNPYPLESKTNLGYYALLAGGAAPPSTSSIHFGSTNVTTIYYGSSPVTAIYFGSTQVF